MERLKQILDILESTNAKDVKVYHYENKSPFYDYVILATLSDRQSNATVGYLKKAGLLDTEKVEGRNTGWTLVDAKDIIVHLFNETERKFYNFEARLADVKEILIK